jgi:hypothetical protein
MGLRDKFKIFKVTKRIRSRDGKHLHFERFSFFTCKYFSINKHIITKADNEKHEHDHPWNFLSFIWKGSYTEMSKGVLYPRKRFSFKYMKAEHQHRLKSIDGDRCVTIVITGRRFREWGFPTEKGWIDNLTYRKMKRKGEI